MKPKILIVEDEEITALDMKVTLENNDFNVVGIANEGQDAIKKAYALKPDIIIMDIMLKGEMDGTDAAAYIHSYYNIPIIFLTAYRDEETLRDAKKAEPLGYLNKPYKEEDMLTTIEIALFKHKKILERKQNEINFQTISNENRVGLGIIQNGNIQYVNPMFSKIVGLEVQELESWTANQLVDLLFSSQQLMESTLKYDYQKFLQKFNSKIITIKTHLGSSKNIQFSIKSIAYGESIADLLTLDELPKSIDPYEIEAPLKNKIAESVSEPTLSSFNESKPYVTKQILSLTECFGNFDRFLVLDSLKDQKLGILELEVILGKSQHTVYKIIRFLNERQIITSEKEKGKTVYAIDRSFFNQFLADWDSFQSQFQNWDGD